MRLHEARGPGDDHRADRIRAHDVRIVIDFDAPQRLFDAESAASAASNLSCVAPSESLRAIVSRAFCAA